MNLLAGTNYRGTEEHLSTGDPHIPAHNRPGFDGKSILDLAGSSPKKNESIR